MKFQSRPWSTPLVIASSIIVALSGVMMFFHLGDELVKGAHEWIGLLSVAAMVLHILNHWPGFRRYFSQRMAAGVMAAVITIGSGFIVASATSDREHPARMVVNQYLKLPLTKLAVVQGSEVDQLQSKLRAAGITGVGAESTLQQLAATHQRHPFELIELLADTGR